MGELSRRGCLVFAAAALAGCAASRAPLRRLQLNLTRDEESFVAVVRAFARREGYWVGERGENDVIGDGMIQLESWRSSVLVTKRDLGMRDPTVVVSDDGVPAIGDMTIVYADDIFEAFFYDPALTIAKPLNGRELDELVVRFTDALVSANVADVSAMQ